MKLSLFLGAMLVMVSVAATAKANPIGPTCENRIKAALELAGNGGIDNDDGSITVSDLKGFEIVSEIPMSETPTGGAPNITYQVSLKDTSNGQKASAVVLDSRGGCFIQELSTTH